MKRVYKFLLKRLLGKLLVNEIDLEQLEVQLGAGTLELRDLLLDTDYLNAQVRRTVLQSICFGLNVNHMVVHYGICGVRVEIVAMLGSCHVLLYAPRSWSCSDATSASPKTFCVGKDIILLGVSPCGSQERNADLLFRSTLKSKGCVS